MSTPAILITLYFAIGVLLMTLAVATPGKEKRTKGFETAGSGDAADAALLIFIALLWPIWLLWFLWKKEQK